MDKNIYNLCETYFIKSGFDKINFNKLSEARQMKLTKELVGSIYSSMKKKSSTLDYAFIEKTKGDFTKLSEYNTIKNSISMIEIIARKTNQSNKELKILQLAIQNIIAKKQDFMNGFKANNELIMMLYSNIVIAIIISTSILIASGIEYIKKPNNEYELILKDNFLDKSNINYFKILEKFNNICSNGSFDKMMSQLLTKKQLTGTSVTIGIAVGVTILGVLSLIVPTLREAIYLYYHTRVKLSDYLRLQAHFIEANVNSPTINLEKSTKNKQQKAIEKLLKLADKIDIDQKLADKKTTMDIKEEDKNISIDNPEVNSFSSSDDYLI